MNILKKILAFAIILGIFGQTGINSFANTNYELENIKYQLSNNNIDDTIKNKIDNFIEKISDKQILKLEKKINILKNGLLNRDDIISKKEEKILSILNYIELKIQEKKLLKTEAEKKDIFNNKLSEVDNKKVNEQLVKIQNNLLNKGINSFEKILGELKNYTNYEEKGNFNAQINFDGGEMGTSKVQLKLKDYVTKNSGFDAQFNSKIEAIIEATPKGKEEIKMQISAFIDYIMKDQNYYVLLKNLKITDEKGIEEIKQYVEKAKEIASKNKYIHFEDKNTTQVLNTLKELNPENILKQGKTIASKPLFTAYKKEGNKYYLVPSKYGCDTAKTLSNKFDPFNGSTCTDSQYQDLLKEIADSKIEFYIDFSKSNTVIGFEADGIDDMEKFNGNISFSDKNIEEINILANPNQKQYPGEDFTFNYKRNKYLNSKFYADKGKNTLNLVSTLDISNNFTKIYFDANLDSFKGKLKLNNKIIAGNYSIENYNSKIVGIISGKTDRYNKISQLKLNNQYISSSSYNPFENNTILEYDNGKYLVDNKYTTEGLKSTLNASFTINKNILTELNFNLDISQKESSYDYNSYKTVYSGDFKNIVDSNISLKNKIISGNTVVYNDNKEFLNIINNGTLEKDKFELNNKIIFNKSLIEQFTGQVSKARDTKRKSDIMTLQTGIEQYYSDMGEYPKTIKGSGIEKYFDKIPKDPSGNIEINGCKFGYYYEVGNDKYGIKNGSYKISSCLENGDKIYKSNNSTNFKTSEGSYINGYKTWVKKEIQKNGKTKPEANFNIKTDTTSNNNNINLYMNYNEDDKNILEIELDNKSKKTYKDVKILAPLPNDTIELEDAVSNPQMY